MEEEEKGTMNTETDCGGLQHVRCSFSLSLSLSPPLMSAERESSSTLPGLLCDTTMGLMGDAPELLRPYAQLIYNE